MLTLSACSTTKHQEEALLTSATPPKATWATREAALNQIRNWHISGKIAMQSRQDSGSASVDWVQRQQNFAISLQGPLGAHATKLSGGPGKVILQSSDGKQVQASSAEQLLAAQSGFRLPVSSMKYWIRGLPVPGVAANTRFDQQGRLTSLIQQGYRIDFLSYSTVRGLALPERLSIVSPAIRVKLIVYQWNI